ncbi:2Fe-2S iron-sulfur cluster-binding protein [Variovorax sp. Sphag1AA]|uniref:2Fe-2S iron-sulfur cluster-binding protein n=1 Tax=Variovorax sp. Sphag1AA TaxID=2587027 RepID=UPI00161AE1E5|nr:2Fe-2S iron-sulfur cluster-binding protein [Variovorax sp. Sphag1AA]MBB3177986.1 2Fe-2S ferredoxin [Variovorax sp. Sphag1AA]
MISIEFHTADGERLQCTAHEGTSVMEIAVAHNVPGIDADCGGACACATCHVHVDPEGMARLPPRGDQELKMLAFAVGVDDGSRLSCQLPVSAAYQGVVFRVPASQY